MYYYRMNYITTFLQQCLRIHKIEPYQYPVIGHDGLLHIEVESEDDNWMK